MTRWPDEIVEAACVEEPPVPVLPPDVASIKADAGMPPRVSALPAFSA
jgi:hypothetical protein